MSNQMTLFQQESGAVLSKKFAPLVQAGVGNDLGDGIKNSYGIVGIKAGKFRLKYKGEEKVLLNPDGTPVGYIDVVIIKANAFLNKQYFEGKYVEGNTSPPVCYSLDGVKPSAASPKKQSATCALCPQNQFGSMVGDNGVKQKACRDTKKLAVVPAADIRNLTMGGAMLFRVPPSSLKELSIMADALKGRGYPYNSVVVRISFDLNASHPKPVFKALRPLDDNEADAVLEMLSSDSVQRVLADNDIVEDHGEQVVAPPAPVRPAGVERITEPVPVPQQPPKIINAADSAPPPPVEQPRVIRLKPEEPPAAPAAAANPFSTPAAPAPKPAPAPAAANPFAPPPTVVKPAPKPEPVVVEGEVLSPQLDSDIQAILAGLDNPG